MNAIDLTSSPEPSPKTSTITPSVERKRGINPYIGSKKIVVKNLRIGTRTNTLEFFERTWKQLSTSIDVILTGGKVVSYEELYRGVENMCKQGYSAQLSDRLEHRFDLFVKEKLQNDLLTHSEKDNVEVLRAVWTAWSTWKRRMTTIKEVCMYLDRSYLLHQARPGFDAIIVSLFTAYILQEPYPGGKVSDGLCELVATDRDSEFSDPELFKNAIGMYHDLGLYTASFEPQLLKTTQSYILTWTDQTLEENDLKGYVESANQLMRKERERCDLYNLDSSTQRKVLTLLEHHLIERQLQSLVDRTDVGNFLDSNAVEDLKNLYSLLEIRNLGHELRPAFGSWISSTGSKIVFDEDHQDEMVVRLLSLKKQLDNVWRTAFQKNEKIGHGFRESFEAFINKSKKSTATWNTDNSKVGEMIAKYVDLLLRGGAKVIPASLQMAPGHSDKNYKVETDEGDFDEDTEINNQLDHVLDLFRFVHGKAVFEAFYKKDLARRLLMGRSASSDAERSMLTRLKTECGAGFTQNLETMFKDIELAREEMTSYESLRHTRPCNLAFDLTVNVLSASAWPTYPDIPCILPPEIKIAQDDYENHYKSKHSGRKLHWKHALAQCQIKANLPLGGKEIIVSSFQAFVLLLFNDVGPQDKINYETVKELTGLPEAEVKRTLQSLACAKLRPLTKHPKGREIHAGDQFSVNLGFQHDRFRVKINQIQLKETKEENKETHERVAQDRNFETQAAIVRIMKGRKTIAHAELVAEVIQATKSRGVLNISEIKRNIDRLIEKDYMERTEGSNNYSYIA